MRFVGIARVMDTADYARAGARSALFRCGPSPPGARASQRVRFVSFFVAMNRLSGKRAVITGAASGIGRASAELFAAEGAAVIACDMNEEGLAETSRRIEAAGGRCRSVVGDASESATVQSLVDGAVKDFGGLDVFYANAGVS